MESFMRLKKINDALVLDIIGDMIDSIEFDIHLRRIRALREFRMLYVDIKYLEEISNDTIQKFRKMKSYLSDRIISFMNVNPTQNCILNLFEMDKIFQFYMNKEDAFEAKKPIIKRKFKIVQKIF